MMIFPKPHLFEWLVVTFQLSDTLTRPRFLVAEDSNSGNFSAYTTIMKQRRFDDAIVLIFDPGRNVTSATIKEWHMVQLVT